jgi:hypothetical protein
MYAEKRDGRAVCRKTDTKNQERKKAYTAGIFGDGRNLNQLFVRCRKRQKIGQTGKARAHYERTAMLRG